MHNAKEKHMFMRVFSFVMAALLLTTLCFGQTATAPTDPSRADYQARLDQAATTVHTQIATLETQLTAAKTAAAQDDLQRQIQDMKRQGEIQRLEILLEWAQAKGDAARATEIEQALNNWRNPPQPQVLPQLEKGAAAPATKSESTQAGK
jgi:hypothetical protein